MAQFRPEPRDKMLLDQFRHWPTEQEKKTKLLDIIRRAIANPGNLNEVVAEIALDWNPTLQIDTKGNRSFVLGSGRKK